MNMLNSLINFIYALSVKMEELTWLYTIIILVSAMCLWRYYNRKLNLPPGPISLPIVGYLPFLGKESFKTFHDLGKIYGNTFSMYLGMKFVVVLNDITSIKDAFLKPATLFRPKEIFASIPGGAGFAASNGSEWHEQRRFTIRLLKSLGFGESKWEQIVKEEVQDVLQTLETSKGQAVDIASLLLSFLNNCIWTLVFGKRLPENNLTRKAIDFYINVISGGLSQTGLSVFMPALAKILQMFDLFGYGKVSNIALKFNYLIKNEILKHNDVNEEGERVYVDEYLKEMQKLKRRDFFSGATLIGDVQVLFLAGGDAIRLALHWLFLAMAAFPDNQKKVHQELDDFVKVYKDISWEDRHELSYTYATILEGQRWRTQVPTNILRETSEDNTICGYHVPKGTTIIANLWNVHNDTNYWKDPEKFQPERFLEGSENKLVSKTEGYAPFSIGKRNCAGMSSALMGIFAAFTSIMLKFEVLPPSELQSLKLDGVLGINYQPTENELRFVSRDS